MKRPILITLLLASPAWAEEIPIVTENAVLKMLTGTWATDWKTHKTEKAQTACAKKLYDGSKWLKWDSSKAGVSFVSISQRYINFVWNPLYCRILRASLEPQATLDLDTMCNFKDSGLYRSPSVIHMEGPNRMTLRYYEGSGSLEPVEEEYVRCNHIPEPDDISDRWTNDGNSPAD